MDIEQSDAETMTQYPRHKIVSAFFLYLGITLLLSLGQLPAQGQKITYIYDDPGRLVRVMNENNECATYEYDTANRMISITDPRGITFLTNEYDSAGRVIRQTQADGGLWTFAYTTTGSFISQTTVTDPRGNNTTYRFNSSGFLISQTDSLGQTTTFDREAGTNLIRATTDSLSRRTSFTYDANGNVTSITDPGGNARNFTYESTFNKLTAITDPLGQVTRFEYDARGNLIATVDPTGARTTIAYNTFGQPVSTTDPLGNVTTFTYDTVGNLVTIADPLGNRTQRSYDLVSRLIAQTDPRAKTTVFGYDDLNRITQILDALIGLTSFTYDANGNLLTVTDARGNTIIHTYDVMDRLATRTDPVAVVESFAYDGAGNLTTHADRKGQVNTFTYDALNRRTSGIYADGATTSFVFDAAGRLTEATDSVSGTVLNQYDNLDRLTAQTTSLGTVSYQYDALGRRTQMDVTGQLPVTYSYDAASRLRQTVQGPQVVDLAYDALGRRTRLTLPNGVSTEYLYDAASRLTALIYRNALGLLGDLTYQYDAAGNRISMGGSFARTLLPDPVANATYDTANRQLTFGEKTMSFDTNGNLTSISDAGGLTIFAWDSRNRLVGLSGPSTTASFKYDALGRRVEKKINSQSTQYHYDSIDIVQELVDEAPVSYLRGLNIDEIFSRKGQEFYVADTQGNTIGLADPSGILTTSYTYEPFGKTTTTGTPSTNSFQYAARENDGTGLYYNRARYYSPVLQRFLSEDPIGLRGGINLYSYTNSNPVNFIDPFGLDTYAIGIGGSFGYVTPSGRGISETSSLLIGFDTQGNIGIINVHGPLVAGGTPGPSVNLGIQSQTSNAQQISELVGPFRQGGGTVGAPIPVGGVPIPASISTDIFAGEAQRGHQQVRIEGSDVTVGLGTPGMSVTGGLTNTEIVFQFNMFDLLKRLFNPKPDLSGRGKRNSR